MTDEGPIKGSDLGVWGKSLFRQIAVWRARPHNHLLFCRLLAFLRQTNPRTRLEFEWSRRSAGSQD